MEYLFANPLSLVFGSLMLLTLVLSLIFLWECLQILHGYILRLVMRPQVLNGVTYSKQKDGTVREDLQDITLTNSLTNRLHKLVTIYRTAFKNIVVDDYHSNSAPLLPIPKLLLQGPPGVGKTMLAKIIASSSDFSYVIISGGDLLALGPTASHHLHEIFLSGKRSGSPLVVILDEPEAIICSNPFIYQDNKTDTDSYPYAAEECLHVLLDTLRDHSRNLGVIISTSLELEDIDRAVLSG